MRVKTIVAIGVSTALLSFVIAAYAAELAGVMALTADEMKWSSRGGLALPGMEQVNLIGSPSQPGPYTLRLKFPAGFKQPPHFRPDAREVTVLSGVWYRGYGTSASNAHG